MIDWPIVRWLLGLDAVAPDATGIRLAFERPLPSWGWVAVSVACATIAWWSYRRIDAPPRRRRTMAALRAATLLLLAMMLAGPMLEVPRERIDPDAALVLADRSRSMEVEDMVDAAGVAMSRDRAVRAVAMDGAFRSIGDEHRVQWFTYAAGADPAATDADGVPTIGEATGDRSLLGRSIEQALDRAAGRPISSVVLVTDGRTTAPPDQALMRRLQSEGVAVSAVALGATEPLGDAAVTDVQAPRRAFSRDLVPVEAVIERRGPSQERSIAVELVDASSGTVLDRSELGPGRRDQVQLVARPSGAGEVRWSVRVVSELGRDLLPANDVRTVPVTLVDRPMRVLYVEGYPRWEYRYLKNLLQREGTVESAVMLLSADRDFAQEGNTPIARLPRTREEFDRFDLVILGDVPASFFTVEQVSEIRRAVSERGMGLVVIGGAQRTPRGWTGSPLEDLLPFVGPLELERLPDPVHMVPTAAAQRLGVLRLADDPKDPFPAELTGDEFPWSRLEWAQRIPWSALKPTTEVLAESREPVDGGSAPLVLTMRFGAGSVVYLATDEVWRWRHGRGEAYPERFWVQLLRAMARPSLGTGQEDVRLAVEPGRAVVGEPVRVEVELPAGASSGGTVALEAIPERPGTAPVELEATPTPGGTQVARWVPEDVGRWTIRPRDPALAARAGSGAAVEVVRDDAELRDAEADRALLDALARETGGRVVDPSGIRTLIESLPNRSVRTEMPIRDAIWSSPLALIMVMLLLVAEWVIRRWSRLA